MNAELKNTAWVVAEHAAGAVRQATYELIAFATDFSQRFNLRLEVIAIGSPASPVAEEIAKKTGCPVNAINLKPHSSENKADFYNAEVYLSALKKESYELRPSMIFIPHTSTGWDYAPALAADIGASCITAVSAFADDKGPLFSRQTCNGKIYEDVRPLPGRPAVVTVMPGAAKPFEGAGKAGAVNIIEMDYPVTRSKTLKVVEAPPQTLNLDEAQAIISAGRGTGGPEHLEVIRELASLFERGAVGASRPVCDNGWLPHEAQVGQTGRTVSPKLYLACGISGAVQHTAGMKNSDLIVAINTDKNSLFCKVAHYCVIEDLHAFLPVLIRKIRDFKGRR